MEMKTYGTVIVGGGPAGLAAAIYTSRARIETLVLERTAMGGQLLLTDNVENYPGYLQVEGGRLMETFAEQAAKFGTETAVGDAREIRLADSAFEVVTDEESYRARTVIVATGSSHRHMGIPGEKEFWGKGVSVCATCDGAFYRDQVVSVVGGGDSAITEALFLKNVCKQVNVIHRRDELRAERILQERLMAAPNVRIIWDTVVDEIAGDSEVRSLRLRNVKSGERSEIPTAGVFLSIGMTPNSAFVRELLRLDANGYVMGTPQMATSVSGIFVAGDVRSASYRQVATSVGDGVTAAISIELWLENPSLIQPLAS